ncbi:hypothetical protein AAHA92_15786 [Salvia divinorum]|uniref:Uncharacterized protein n=1 Tax=Salvia divinorum TaxID=28513 RepID=A0ABD1HFU0_SALDI
MPALNASAQISAQKRTTMINAVFALNSLELEYGHHGHFWASHLSGCDTGGSGGDMRESNSATAIATLAPKEVCFFSEKSPEPNEDMMGMEKLSSLGDCEVGR